jgi:hypothetical protein
MVDYQVYPNGTRSRGRPRSRVRPTVLRHFDRAGCTDSASWSEQRAISPTTAPTKARQHPSDAYVHHQWSGPLNRPTPAASLRYSSDTPNSRWLWGHVPARSVLRLHMEEVAGRPSDTSARQPPVACMTEGPSATVGHVRLPRERALAVTVSVGHLLPNPHRYSARWSCLPAGACSDQPRPTSLMR